MSFDNLLWFLGCPYLGAYFQILWFNVAGHNFKALRKYRHFLSPRFIISEVLKYPPVNFISDFVFAEVANYCQVLSPCAKFFKCVEHCISINEVLSILVVYWILITNCRFIICSTLDFSFPNSPWYLSIWWLSLIHI